MTWIGCVRGRNTLSQQFTRKKLDEPILVTDKDPQYSIFLRIDEYRKEIIVRGLSIYFRSSTEVTHQ